MKRYRVYFRIGMCHFWKLVEAENAKIAKEMVERSYWVLRADRPIETNQWVGNIGTPTEMRLA